MSYVFNLSLQGFLRSDLIKTGNRFEIFIQSLSLFINLLYICYLLFSFYRIDSNIDDTALNVEAAHGEILKYFQSVTSNRWLMIKIFVVLIVFFIVFVVFFA